MPKLAKTQADAIVAQLIQIKQNFNREIEELITGLQAGGSTRTLRNYDVPTPDPTLIAEKYGVDLTDDEGEVPEWMRSRIDRLMTDSETK